MGAVVLGVGGGGKTVLMKMRRLIVEEFPELEPQIQFLHIDTFAGPGPEVNQDFVVSTLGTDISLKPEERVELSPGLSPTETAKLIQHPSIRPWFPPQLDGNIDLSKGAGAIRAYGRLAFHHKIAELHSKLDLAIQRAQSNRHVDILIVCSLFGGTGSGAFLDVCYTARAVRRGFDGEDLGFFIIGDAPNVSARNNCFAALQELEYYTGLGLKGTSSLPFKASYAVGGVEAVNSNLPPVDASYLFEPKNRRVALGRSDLEELIAKRMLFEILPPTKQTLVAKRIDLRGTDQYTQPDALQNRAKTFFATGCSTIEFPGPRLQIGCAAALTAGSHRLLMNENAAGFADLRLALANFVDTCFDVKLGPENLIKELEKQGDASTVHDSVRDDLFKWHGRLTESIGKGSLKDGTIGIEVDNVHKEAGRAMGSGGTYERTLAVNAENLLNRNSNKTRQQTADLVVRPNIGPKHAEKFIEALVLEFSTYEAKAESERDRAAMLAQSAGAKVRRKIRHTNRDRKYPWEIGKHIDWLCNRELKAYMQTNLKAMVYAKMGEIYGQIIVQLESERQRIEKYRIILGKQEEVYTEEASALCRNLLSWIDGESKLKDRTVPYLDDLRDFLVRFGRLCEKREAHTFSEILGPVLQKYNVEMSAGGIPYPVDILEQIKSNRIQRNQPDNLYLAVLDQQEELGREVFEESRSKLSFVKNVNICNVLSALDPASMDALLQGKVDRSDWYAMLFMNDPSISHVPGVHELQYVIVPSQIPIDRHPIWSGSLAAIPPDARANTLSDSFRVVLVSEVSVFCLRNIGILTNYGMTFGCLDHESALRHHTDCRINFPDIIPPSEEAVRIIARVSEAALIGRIAGLIEEAVDPQTRKKAIFLHYVDSMELRRNKLLCDTWVEAAGWLQREQEAKELKHGHNGLTSLEIMEQEIERLACKARWSPAQRKELCSDIDGHLRNLLSRLDGDGDEAKKRNPLYQSTLNQISGFLNKNCITCVLES